MNEAIEKPLIEHLKELRKRLVYCAFALVLSSLFSYLFVKDIYQFLVKPLADILGNSGDRKMIFTNLTEAFFTYLRLSVFSGIILSFPIIAYQVYSFCAPGLYKNEKRFFIPFIFVGPILFFIGASFVYYFLFPTAWKFFLSFEIPSGNGSLPIMLEAKISEYLSLVTALILAFGITFQLPLLVVLLVKIGLVDVNGLKKFRKFAFIIILTVAAFITPPDVFSQLALAIPLYLLYEASILFCKYIKKNG
jgi:sec-independent protein translocase protein TatC